MRAVWGRIRCEPCESIGGISDACHLGAYLMLAFWGVSGVSPLGPYLLRAVC